MAKITRILAIGLTLFSLAGCETMTGKTAGENVDDAAITASVKSRLVADKATNLFRVDVDTERGVVYLTGVVSSSEQKTQAEDLARRVKGVRNVVNNIQVAQR